MKEIFKIFTKSLSQIFTRKIDKPLGRWNMEYCSKKLDTKIDMSNEDHCGPCGQYVIDKSNKSLVPYMKSKIEK